MWDNVSMREVAAFLRTRARKNPPFLRAQTLHTTISGVLAVPLTRAALSALFAAFLSACSVATGGAGSTPTEEVMVTGPVDASSTGDGNSGTATDPLEVGVGGSLVGVDPMADSDGDGTPDIVEGTLDRDDDGIPAHLDPDETGTNPESGKSDGGTPDSGTEPAPVQDASAPVLGAKAIGSACSEEADCASIVGAGSSGTDDNPGQCRTDSGFFTPQLPGGYCSAECLFMEDGSGPGGTSGGPPAGTYPTCGSTSVCGPSNHCLHGCDRDSDCREDEDYFCDFDVGGCTDGVL
jgi:hypothetical protein